jgi:hypothetical protein
MVHLGSAEVTITSMEHHLYAHDTIMQSHLAVPCNPVRFDEDGDGDVDQADFAAFQVCLTDMDDPNGIYDPAACQCMDSDNDQDIDALDRLAFETCASGAGVPANPACDNSP